MEQETLLAAVSCAPILIVDDDPLSRSFVEKALKNKGFTHILLAENGAEALAAVKKQMPELIILDIDMPEMDGLECCRIIRSQPAYGDTPILMLTSLAEEKWRFESFAAGATDFVSKPIHPQELFARVSVHLQNRLSLKSLREYKNRLDLELQSAYALQAAILPSAEEIGYIQDQCCLEITSHLHTSSEIGGDFWGARNLFPHQTALWMVDFSGHGVAAALNAARLQTHLKEHSTIAAKPGEYLSHLNEKLLQLLMPGHFATMFYGVIDTRGNKLYYACACNPHPLILRRNGTVEQHDGSGMPLGICMQFYPTQNVDFYPGDTLILYSDALTETPDAQGDYIVEAQLKEMLSQHPGACPAELQAALLSLLAQHSSASPSDDLTFLLCRRTDQDLLVSGDSRTA